MTHEEFIRRHPEMFYPKDAQDECGNFNRANLALTLHSAGFMRLTLEEFDYAREVTGIPDVIEGVGGKRVALFECSPHDLFAYRKRLAAAKRAEGAGGAS